MKKIVFQLPQNNFIDIPDVINDIHNNSGTVVVYKRDSGNSYCMLSRLNTRGSSPLWGFCPIGEINSKPTFTDDIIGGTIQNALKAGRDVRVFTNIFEFTACVNRREF